VLRILLRGVRVGLCRQVRHVRNSRGFLGSIASKTAGRRNGQERRQLEHRRHEHRNWTYCRRLLVPSSGGLPGFGFLWRTFVTVFDRLAGL
jgi:hypothetical protein